MAESGVYDRWHKSRAKAGEPPCGEHKQGDRPLIASAAHGRGKRWQARWRDGEGEQRKLNYAKKSDAERQLTSIQADLLRGTYVDHRAGKVTFRSYAELRWLPAQHHLRPNSTELYISHLRNHVVPLLGGRQIGAAPDRYEDVRRGVVRQARAVHRAHGLRGAAGGDVRRG